MNATHYQNEFGATLSIRDTASNVDTDPVDVIFSMHNYQFLIKTQRDKPGTV